jgi:hypothetical protein
VARVDGLWHTYARTGPQLHFLVAVMARELGWEIIRAGQLADDLRLSEAALKNSKKDLRKLLGRMIAAQEEELRRLAPQWTSVSN